MWGMSDADINAEASPAAVVGLSPGAARLPGAEGAVLPASTYSGPDKGAVPWSPDSPLFWGGLVGIATLLGFIGASARLRVGKAQAKAEVNSEP